MKFSFCPTDESEINFERRLSMINTKKKKILRICSNILGCIEYVYKNKHLYCMYTNLYVMPKEKPSTSLPLRLLRHETCSI